MVGSRRCTRRVLMRQLALGGALVLALPAFVATSASAVTTPTFVAGSQASAFVGPYASGFHTRVVTVTSANVQAGDLWVGLAAYNGDGGLNIQGTGWSAPTPHNAGGPGDIYSTRAWVFWKVLAPSDVVGGRFSATIVTGADGAQFGGARFAGLAYRGARLTATVAGSAVAQGAGGLASTADVTFPAVATPAGNTVVRLGAARGYGGYLAGQGIHWTSAPGTTRIAASDGNTGDRAIVISEQPNGSGAAASGQYFTALWGNRNRVTYTVAISSAG